MHELAKQWDESYGYDSQWTYPEPINRKKKIQEFEETLEKELEETQKFFKKIKNNWKKENGEWKPIGRPCDWCGKNVETGWIHKECAKAEQEKWLEILY